MPEEHETTNAVLAEKINGLAKLTDERLITIKDSLSRIELSNANFATKTELDEVKKDFTSTIGRIEQGFIKHNDDDKESFGTILKGQRKVQNTIAYASGGIAVLIFLLPFALKYGFGF